MAGVDRLFCYLEAVLDLKKPAALLMFSAVVSIGAAGCGGSDDSEDPVPAPVETTTDTAGDLTRDELIEEGDAICTEVNAAVGTINSSTTADPSIQETQISDIYSGLAQSLSELGTPTDGEAPTEVIDAAEALAESGATDGETALTDFQTAATDYGFTECGDAPVAPSSSDVPLTGTDPSAVPADPGYVPPVTTPEPVPAPPATAPPTSGGGVAPAPPPSTGGSSGGSSSGGGGISPG